MLSVRCACLNCTGSIRASSQVLMHSDSYAHENAANKILDTGSQEKIDAVRRAQCSENAARMPRQSAINSLALERETATQTSNEAGRTRELGADQRRTSTGIARGTSGRERALLYDFGKETPPARPLDHTLTRRCAWQCPNLPHCAWGRNAFRLAKQRKRDPRNMVSQCSRRSIEFSRLMWLWRA